LVKSRVLDHLQDAIRHRLIEQGKTPRGDNSPSPALWSCQRIESWATGFSFATDTKAIVKDSKDNQEDLAIVKQFMTTVSDSTAAQLIKFKEYYPSLFSGISLSLNLKDPKDIDTISSVKFTVKYRLAESGRG
jgi:hypothetical protein